jgi:protein-disulfide isomerase
MFLPMKLLLLCSMFVAACHPSDGGARGTPTGGASAAAKASSDSNRINAMLERADKARIQGDSAAPVWLVEISDFECPFCKRWHDETYPALQKEYIQTGRVRLAYVNFPLGQHPHALPAAEAAMCAAAQDRFWPMHDSLFNSQPRWASMGDASALYDSLAVSVGVNAGEWRECVRSGVMRRLVSADHDRGQSAGVRSTPTFFVGDEPIQGAESIGTFRAAIERARAKAARTPPP